MAQDGSGSNGNKPPRPPMQTPLERLEARVTERAQAEAARTGSNHSSGDTEPLFAWRDVHFDAGSSEFQILHRGLVEVSQIAEAAIENSLQSKAIATRNEGMLMTLRKDVQSLKEDLRDIRVLAEQLPTIKNLLMEILARLPESRV